MERLKTIREKRNITQIRLSVGVSVSQETISAYESGKAMPSADTLVKLADFLNTSTDYLLGRIKDDTPLNQISNEIVDKQLTELLNNYARLNNNQKKDLIWYSEKVQDKQFN